MAPIKERVMRDARQAAHERRGVGLRVSRGEPLLRGWNIYSTGQLDFCCYFGVRVQHDLACIAGPILPFACGVCSQFTTAELAKMLA